MTGRGADLMILDDVIKSDVEALSETTQRRHWDWWRSVVLTRLHPDAAIVAVGTRWSVDDLLGKLADSGSFDVIRLPALAEDNDPIGREPGAALWPAMFPKDVLKAIKKGTSPAIDGPEGRRSVEIILGIYKSAETGKAIQLPLAKDPVLKARKTGVGK